MEEEEDWDAVRLGGGEGVGVGEKESGKGIVWWGGELEVGDAESGRELWRCEMGDNGLGVMEGTPSQ